MQREMRIIELHDCEKRIPHDATTKMYIIIRLLRENSVST